jgi:hypothetical protein
MHRRTAASAGALDATTSGAASSTTGVNAAWKLRAGTTLSGDDDDDPALPRAHRFA